jgi:hypothetical protein
MIVPSIIDLHSLRCGPRHRKISPANPDAAKEQEARSFMAMSLTMDLDSPDHAAGSTTDHGTGAGAAGSAPATVSGAAGRGPSPPAPTLDGNPSDTLRRLVLVSSRVNHCRTIPLTAEDEHGRIQKVLMPPPPFCVTDRSSLASAYGDVDRAALAAAIQARLTPYVPSRCHL